MVNEVVNPTTLAVMAEILKLGTVILPLLVFLPWNIKVE
jgi:hypothetical protein